MKITEQCEFVFDVEYYVRKFLVDEISDHGIDPPEDQIKIIRENITAFLDDCVRVGWYLYLNFYDYPEKIKGSCYPMVVRFWTYQMYLKEKRIGICLSCDYPFNEVMIIRKEEKESEDNHLCGILQNLDFLPHPEIMESCHLMKSGGIKHWHDGRINNRMAVKYEIPEYSLREIEERIKDIDIKKQIMDKNIPYLANWVIYLLNQKSQE